MNCFKSFNYFLKDIYTYKTCHKYIYLNNTINDLIYASNQNHNILLLIKSYIDYFKENKMINKSIKKDIEHSIESLNSYIEYMIINNDKLIENTEVLINIKNKYIKNNIFNNLLNYKIDITLKEYFNQINIFKNSLRIYINLNKFIRNINIPTVGYSSLIIAKENYDLI